MGAIRKALFVATVGAVAPRSKKQKVALQTLSAIQGKSEATVRRTGTRRQAIYGTPRSGTIRGTKPKFTAEELAYCRAHFPGKS